MAKAAIDLFFDVLSPYSWIGFEALCRYRTVWNIELRLRPFLLGGIMKESGNQPPGILPARGAYMAKDIDRNRDYWQIPLGHLKDPFDALLNKGSMAPERYLISLGMAEPDRVEDAARELWMRRWSRDEDFHLPQHLAEVSKKIGLSTEVTKKVISRIDTTEIKDKLKANTNEALEEGAFGAPWIVVHHPNGKKYSFFGSDRFHIMADILGEKFPGPMRELAKSKL